MLAFCISSDMSSCLWVASRQRLDLNTAYLLPQLYNPILLLQVLSPVSVEYGSLAVDQSGSRFGLLAKISWHS